MKGYYITSIQEFPLWRPDGKKMNRAALNRMIEEIATGKRKEVVGSYDIVELVKPHDAGCIQFVYWSKSGEENRG